MFYRYSMLWLQIQTVTNSFTIGFSIRKGKVLKAGFEGKGCVVSQAGAALLCDFITGKPIKQLEKLSQQEFLERFSVKIPLHSRNVL